MTNIAFVGLGNMGGPMALNLVKHGHQVVGFDLSTDACARLVAGGGKDIKTGAVALACLDILAAVGLWIRAVWGPVMWAIAVIVETVMYTFLSDLFGSHPLRVAVHCVLIGIFLALAVANWRRAAQL